MADGKHSVLLENLAWLSQPDNFQRCVLGTKGNGQPRALYDIVKDCTKKGKKKKKKKHNDQINGYSLYLTAKKDKKKKKKKKKKNKDKYWHI